MLNSLGHIETDIYYKDTNAHDYLSFSSHHPQHIKSNIPFNLAKRIIIFCSDSQVEKTRLAELKQWLLNCTYPIDLIDKAFHNAKLQGPAPKPITTDTLPLITTYFGNYDCNHMSTKVQKLLTTSEDVRIRTVFSNTRTVLALHQPPNILRHVSRAEFTSGPRMEGQDWGLFNCKSKKCILFRNYIQECKSFITSNNVQYIIRSHITCNSLNIIYYLRCLCCNRKVTYSGRTSELRGRMNNHISECRTGNTTDIFDKHVLKCKQNSTREEPFFEILAFLQVKEAYMLPAYEKHIHSLKYDTMNR